MGHGPPPAAYPFPTLPDLLAPGLTVVFVGINPGLYSVERGHYFARKTNRFWPAFSRSRLSARAREALGVDRLGPEHDSLMPAFGIGFTDVVKRPSRKAADVAPAEFKAWAPRLLERLAACRPRLACFHGLTGYRPFLHFALGRREATTQLGLQTETIGATRLFVVPNPSPANAHFTLDDQVVWYDRVAEAVR
ncbi:MAG TPA: mismatch-specific DNA-glycosylase [Chloroflexota bacterium]|nr:mismatch-specific DNA-glycosylase [Chloroflexota bacterium]